MRGYQLLKNSSDNKKDFIFFFVLLFGGILIFAPSLQIPFIRDKIAFIKRSTVSNVTQLLALFDKKELHPPVLSKSSFTSRNEVLHVNSDKSGNIILTHNKDNYFLLFDNKKNINFDLKTGKQLSFPIIREKGTLYVFFSEGKFQKISGKL